MARRGTGRVLGVLAALLALVVGPGALTAAATSSSASGSVYIVHGIAGLTADILVDGTSVAPAAAPKTVVGPLQLNPGDHVLTLRQGTQTVVSARFAVQAGASVDVVAHRTADSARQSVVTVFVNDLSAVRSGMTRLVVSHVAVAPPADIRVDGEPLFRNVASGESLTLDLAAKTYTLDVVPTMTSGPAILGPVEVELTAGTLTRVFAIGDSTAGTTDAIVQVIPVTTSGSQRPIKVQTGDGGQAAALDGGPWRPGAAGVALTAAVLAFAALLLVGRRDPSRPVVGSRHSTR